MLFIGIDPGASGGLAFIHGEDKLYPEVKKMPETLHDLHQLVFSKMGGHGSIYGCLEKVGGYIKGRTLTGSAMFKFGMYFGWAESVLAFLEVTYTLVPPRRWQREFVSPRGKTETKGDWKKRLKAEAQRRFPTCKGITLATTDALMIAEYCRIIHARGELK